ncbi:TetR family transcriptional regulator [Variovorax sp. WS11]|uniref:TetR/AcrR family transcriptional regulator n=1 Tax=Variovorax sp. WS11 TaxID=1105204 RepID=UPI000D0CBD32|nr:TetR/AcrR family transcriptional regulator C-terminal domain-containing protein [Variovorax sp. WS11]NDZ17158.1 TetR family transcriptional regulator [Variovorax sp. WS11]PSL78985.1 TetR family transcriptional regulator [Variovorax sp. WS11]
MGRPARFTREQLQRAALALVDAQGLAGLTMRALASELETGAMTLYNYVSQREELELLVVEAVIGQAQWAPDDDLAWHEELEAIAVKLWRSIRIHPHVVPLILTRRSRSPAVFEVTEALLRTLARSGRTGDRLLIAFRAVSALIMGAAQAELAGPLALQAGESASETIARFQALSQDRFPHLIEIATAASASDAETEFRAGLALLVDGLRTEIVSGR